MKLQISVTQMLAELEAQVSYHRKQEAYHAEQEVYHREERARHAADLETAQARYESFRAAAESAGEWVGPKLEEAARAQARKPQEPDKDAGKAQTLSRAIRAVVVAKPAQEVFGASSVLRELQGKGLSRVDVRTVGVTLRRLQAAGEIHLVQEGRAYHEAQYSRGPAGKK